MKVSQSGTTARTFNVAVSALAKTIKLYDETSSYKVRIETKTSNESPQEFE